ncbi:asparagine synthase (glutamine-hydrolyzing) [Lentzea sp. NPDC004782]|uniref:asparagine synthase (glutamine-hydrolyzing) n=1 Tax=Lentzea sp. NPDC004782 TaxID=3154458 RepID=UPI0033BC3B67
MCGIAGWVSYDCDLTRRQTSIEAMTATMACRGPDDYGTWIRRNVALGHRRLSVIDIEGGSQPMCTRTPGGTIAMVYSGETYNFAELRTELTGLGHLFRTTSDTEVVLHGYLQWGEAVADRLNGMYAFAIWDERTDELLMIRDRMGVKPFYFHPTRDGVLFGSEPRAILANSLVDRVVDLDGLRELVALCKPPGWAMWRGMREVEPGTVVTVSRKGIRTRTYWKLGPRPHTDDFPTTIATVRELMTDTVERQLVADVPLGVLLSGGVDSSSLSGLAASRIAGRGERLRTFSVDFVGHEENFQPDPMHPESDAPYIRDVVRRIHSEHHETVLSAAELGDPEVRRTLLAARGIPVGTGDMDVSLHLLCKSIRSLSTVVLSGESADELFGGYRWFHDEESVWTDTFPWLAFRKTMLSERTRMLDPSLVKRLDLPGYVGDQYATAVAQIEHLDGEQGKQARMRTISHLALTRFNRLLLDRKDRASMAAGLEVRVPFCDHRMVEYVYNAPWSFKAFDGRAKSLLHRATRHVLPESVRRRSKSAYPCVQDSAYAATLQQQVKEVLTEPGHQLFDLTDRSWAQRMTGLDPATMSFSERSALDRLLDFYHWIDLCRPQLQLT